MGYIYLLENEIGKEIRYKIGYTKNLKNRTKQLETGNPGDMKIIKSFKTDWGILLEKMIHKSYKQYNIKNEWFILNNDQINLFLDNCNKFENNLNVLKENYFFNKKYKK